MVKYKIIHDRENCIGCGACAAIDDENWSMEEDGKSTLKNSKEINKKIFELIIDEKDLDKYKESSECCPVDIIKIQEIEEEK